VTLGANRICAGIVSLYKEETWGIKVAVVLAAGLAVVHEKCTKRFAQIAKRNVKFLLSLEMTVQCIAGIVFQSARIKAVKWQLIA
jgi:hypothetical protein